MDQRLGKSCSLSTVLRNCECNALSLLNGLEECLGDISSPVGLSNELSTLKILKACLASRPEAPLPGALGHVASFHIQEVNHPGIYAYATHEFKTPLGRSKLPSITDFDAVASAITERSRGFFSFGHTSLSNKWPGASLKAKQSVPLY